MTPTAEFKLVPLRETAAPHTRPLGDTPDAIADYWRQQVETSPNYSHTTEQAAVIMLNTRRRITGHVIAATGTLDTILIHPREIFHAAILANAAAIVLCHNHPSGVMPHPVLCRMACDWAQFSLGEPLPDAA